MLSTNISLQKNVYTVFRASPPSVGFAELSELALSMNGANVATPSPTIGLPAATVSSTSNAGTHTLPLDFLPLLTTIIAAASLGPVLAYGRTL